MTEYNYDVVALGNAIVDVLAKVDDSFIAKNGMVKGSMSLIDEQTAHKIYNDMPPALEASGGSAANTVAGIASFGGKAAFIGKVKNDTLGEIFSHDLNAIGVHYSTKAATEGAATARCLISVTPDAERTMATYLGATRGITIDDIDESLIKNSKVLYLEGYLWDEQNAKLAMKKAIEIAAKHSTKVALSLSDSFCVERHKSEFLELIKSGVDILFANEAEVKSLFDTDDFNTAVKEVARISEVAAVTRGAAGSVVISDGSVDIISVPTGLKVVDTTGAGDLYASGFLYGYTQNKTLEECGKLGTLAASEIIQHMGARPAVKLASLAA